ncbi:carboxypeptidase-like regulatory domain-containing protein [Metabacillus lacus]|uniref:carboxypeptidase-like regulatory domain-containing protein n=1 Tax=Metabacillus lacus TaxID=1983721 RepID=UPI00147868F7|nr:carboxypeptidase-like regulatory domain-containing protein [Metabacillus lacus]
MKIKVKIKHIIAAFLSLLILVPLSIFLIVPQLQLYMGGEQLAAGKENGKQTILKALEGTAVGEQRWDTIRKHMIDDTANGIFEVYVGPSFTTVDVSDEKAGFTFEEKLPFLQEYVEKGPADFYLRTAAAQLAGYYFTEGEVQAAMDVLQQGEKRVPASWEKAELQLYRAKLLIRDHKLTEAQELLKYMKAEAEQEESDLHGEIALLEAEILLGNNNLAAATELVSNIKEKLETEYQEQKEEDDEEWTPAVLEQLRSLHQHLQKALKINNTNTFSTIKGRIVRSDGTPVSHAGVFLREEQVVHRSVTPGDQYQVFTDSNGNFTIASVIPGAYQIYLGLSFEQIDGWTYPIPADPWIDLDGTPAEDINIVLQPLMDLNYPVNQEAVSESEISFAWEKVKGAAYYDISVGVEMNGGSITSPLFTKIRDNELTVPLEELYDKRLGYVSENADWKSVAPESIIAFTNTEDRFSWSVEAFNSEGDLITRSNGYRLDEKTMGNLPFFYLKERSMSEADRLLLDKKIQKAYDKYKEDYEKDAEDKSSLRMLARLKGWERSVKGESAGDSYLEAWAEVSTNADDAFDLAEQYAKKRDWKNYQRWYEIYKTREKALSEYVAGYHAGVLMKQGKVTEAREAFQMAMKLDPHHRFIGSWLALELSTGKSFEEAENLAKQYPQREFGGKSKNWADFISNMAEEAEEDHSYQLELQEALGLYLNDDIEKLQKLLNNTEREHLKTFLSEVREVR